MKNYLQNIPQEAQLWGIAKILLVRREIINLKHYQISPNIHSLREAIEFTQNKSMVLFISDNKKSLTNAWCFGVKTFLIEGNNIRHFSLKTT